MKKSFRIPYQDKSVFIARTGLLIAVAFILSYIESLLPAFTGIPGVKAGLSNIVSMVALYLFGPLEAIVVVPVRIILSGLTFSGLYSMIYSLAGAALSLSVMILLSRSRRFSVLAVSTVGGVLHNIGQLAIATFVVGDAILYYLPILIISGTIAGAIVGLASAILCKYLPKK